MKFNISAAVLLCLLLISCNMAGDNKDSQPTTTANSPSNPAPAVATADQGSPGSSAAADLAPDFRFTAFDGTAGSLHSLFGQPLVVNFWAVWCPPCREEFPDMQKVYTARAGQFRMLSVCIDREMNPQDFVKSNGLTWDFAYDEAGSGAKAYQVKAIPTTLFIDRKGNLIKQHRGGMDQRTFENLLASIL
jgi:peroxiredoxin